LPTYLIAQPLNPTRAPHIPHLPLVSGMTRRQATAKTPRSRLPRSTE